MIKVVNADDLPVDTINEQMREPRPLPMGRAAFDDWAERIISGALIPNNSGEPHELLIESQRFALANMLMHLGPTESHKPDAYFIHSLRKFAINQVADTVRKELHDAAKARTAAAEAQKQAEVCAPDGATGNDVLNPDISPWDNAR